MIVMTIKRSIWCLRHLLLACMRRYDEKHHPPDAFTAAYTDIFFPFSPGCDQDYTCSGTWRMRQPELLHSLTVKLAETFLALRQAEEGKKKLAAAHRYDQQHVDKLASIDTVSKSDADASSSSSSSWGAEIMLWSDKRVFGLTAGH